MAKENGFNLYRNDNPTTVRINELTARFIELYSESKVGVREFGAAFADAMVTMGYQDGMADVFVLGEGDILRAFNIVDLAAVGNTLAKEGGL